MKVNKFKPFRMGELFEKIKVKRAKKDMLSKTPSTEFSIPVVYAKYGDNGIMYWGKKDSFDTYKNVISIVYNGVISAGKVYAHERPTGILAESYLIRLKHYDSVPFEANLYMSIIIEFTIYQKYSRENLATWDKKVENDIIYLPVVDGTDDVLDFEYMRAEILELEKGYAKKIDIYLKAVGLNDCDTTSKDLEALSETTTKKTFKMGDLFIKLKAPYKGTGRKQDNVSRQRTSEFSLPLINCKDGDNGVMYYGRKKDFTSHKNVLSIIYNGPPTEGQTYFQDEIGLYTDAYIVGLKNDVIANKEIGLYLTTAINKAIHNREKKKYSRGNKATWENKVENDKIILPVKTDCNGNAVIDNECKYHPDGYIPDFEYMERYIKALEKQVISEVIKLKNNLCVEEN